MPYLEKLLGKNESILFSTRRHWTALFAQLLFWSILFFIAIGIAIAINSFTQTINFGLQPTQEILVRETIVLIVLIYPVVGILVRYLRWQGEQYVVTNLRVIHLKGVLSKSVIDSSLEKVNDVMLQQSFLGRLFGYGDLEILTASETGVNRFTHLAQPLLFKGTMLEAKQALEHGDLEQAGKIPDQTDKIPDLIAKLAALRDQGALTEQEFQTGKTQLLRQLERQ